LATAFNAAMRSPPHRLGKRRDCTRLLEGGAESALILILSGLLTRKRLLK